MIKIQYKQGILQTYYLSASKSAVSHLSIVTRFAKRPSTPSMLPCVYCAPGYPHEPSASGLHLSSPLVLPN